MVNDFLTAFYKKYPVAVTEKWDWWHTDEHRKELWAKLDEMRKQGKTSYTDNGTYSHYAEDGSPTKYFRDMEAAEEYMNWLSKWNPVSLTVKDMSI